MSRDNVFWGVILLIVGSLFLADTLGYFTVDINLLWPFFIIALGIYVLLGRFTQPKEITSENVSVPLGAAKEASIHLEHGAGSVRISGGASKSDLLSGKFSALRLSNSVQGTKARVSLRTAVEDTFFMIFPWNWTPGRRTWDFKLNSNIPISLKVESGASEHDFDLSDTQVVSLDIDTGASSTKVTMPKKAGHTKAEISGGAASFEVTIPKGVAAKIRVDSGLGSVVVDEERFPRAGKGYQSANYDSAANTLDLRLEAGVSSIKIR